MITKSAIDKSYLKKERIELGAFFDAEPGEVWVELREPSTMEMLKIRSELEKSEDQIEKGVELFESMLPGLIVGHCFYDDDKGEKKMSNESVRDVIYQKYHVAEKVLSDFFLKCIPQKKIQEK